MNSATPYATYCLRKLEGSIRVARGASRDSWLEPKRFRGQNLTVRKEAMQDARYWREQLNSI